MTTLAHRGLRTEAMLAKPCGVRAKYAAGCRCDACRAANSAYELGRQAARKAGDWNGIVSADRARAHLVKLSRAGVGKRTVAAASDLSVTVLHDVRTGRKAQIRARTERRILAVTPDLLPESALVPAKGLHRRIAALLEEGFTKRALARQLGYRNDALQFNARRVTARNAARVERLYRRWMA